MAGQHLFHPPNVAGWDDARWLDTATFRGRWWLVNYALEPFDAEKLVDRAVAFWGTPILTWATRRTLTDFATRAIEAANASWKRETYPVLIQNALRQLVAISPDYQTC